MKRSVSVYWCDAHRTVSDIRISVIWCVSVNRSDATGRGLRCLGVGRIGGDVHGGVRVR